MSDQIFVARESFTITLDGVPTPVHKGRTRVREGHALLEGREHLFEPLTVQFDLPEQATAAPGEKRNTPAPAAPVAPYADMKQRELKKELKKRGIDAPNGVGVTNASLIELLAADDAKHAGS